MKRLALALLILAAPAQAQMQTLTLPTGHACDCVLHESQWINPTGGIIYVWAIDSWITGGNAGPGGFYWTCFPQLGDSLADQHIPEGGEPSNVTTGIFARPYIVGPTDTIEIGTSCCGGGARTGAKLLKYTLVP